MKKYYLLIALLPLLASCSIYHPQSVDIPLINHQGDVRVDANMSMSAWIVPDAMNLNATGTVGLTDWLSGQLHANYGGDNAYVQAAPGVYFPLSDNFVMEGYVSFGYGGIWRNADGKSDRKEGENSATNKHSYSGNFMLPFAQVNAGWHDLGRVHFGVAFGLKVGGYMPDFHYDEFDANDNIISGRSEHYTVSNLLVEPQVQVSLGGEHVRWVSRLGFAWLSDVSNSNSSTRTFLNDWMTFGTGIQLTF